MVSILGQSGGRRQHRHLSLHRRLLKLPRGSPSNQLNHHILLRLTPLPQQQEAASASDPDAVLLATLNSQRQGMALPLDQCAGLPLVQRPIMQSKGETLILPTFPVAPAELPTLQGTASILGQCAAGLPLTPVRTRERRIRDTALMQTSSDQCAGAHLLTGRI